MYFSAMPIDHSSRTFAVDGQSAVSGEADLTNLSQRPDEQQELTRLLAEIARYDNPVFRDLAFRRTALFADELRQLAGGRLNFANTETWRATYDRVLLSLDSTDYHSVSWVKTDGYWDDLPGRQSMKLNFELLGKSLHIERILILGWNLWPAETRLPTRSIRQWIEDQHFRVIEVSLARENDLISEPDLLRDFGVYGERATGEQETDGESRTVRFVLAFYPASRRLANDRWERLRLFARPYGELLDQSALTDYDRARRVASRLPDSWRRRPGAILIRPGWA